MPIPRSLCSLLVPMLAFLPYFDADYPDAYYSDANPD